MVSEATPRTYCPNCGSETSAGDQFCRSCGHSLTGSISAAAAATGAPAAVVVAPASRRGWLALGVVIFLAIVAAAAFIGLQASGVLSPRHTITGTFDLIDTSGISSGISFLGGTCEGDGGYGDISAGTNVSLKDGDGKLLASTSLGPGSGSTSRCTFEFEFQNVPEVSFYTVEVGRRGQITNSLADMKAAGWTFALTMGD